MSTIVGQQNEFNCKKIMCASGFFTTRNLCVQCLCIPRTNGAYSVLRENTGHFRLSGRKNRRKCPKLKRKIEVAIYSWGCLVQVEARVARFYVAMSTREKSTRVRWLFPLALYRVHYVCFFVWFQPQFLGHYSDFARDFYDSRFAEKNEFHFGWLDSC